MLGKAMFKTSSTSYSQFLHLKVQKIHSFSDSKEVPIDIDFFRRSVSLHYQHLYAEKKWQNWFYRLIFFAFGLIFLMLGILIFFKTTNFACGFYFSNCGTLKNGINFACFLLATGSFILGYQIHPEKEAVRYLVSKVERELTIPSKQLQIEFNAIFANLSPEGIPFNQNVWMKKTFNPSEER